MSSFLLSVAAPLAALAAYAGAAAIHGRRALSMHAEWQEYGERRGLRYSLQNDLLGMSLVQRLEGSVHDVSVTVETGLGILHSATTTISGRAPTPLGGRLYACRDPLFARTHDAFDVSRMRTGDPAFDGDVFYVEATRDVTAERALSPLVRSALLELSRCGRQSIGFRYEGSSVAVEWLGEDVVPELFDRGCEVVVAACHAARGLDVYR